MGVILDSSTATRAERSGDAPDAFLRQVFSVVGIQDIALSAVGYTELVHGTYRGRTNAERKISRQFLDDLVSALPVYDYTKAIADLVGKIDAEQRIKGLPVPFVDLMIGATALSHGYSVLTTNLRHFRLIPGLEVIPF